MTDTTTKNNTEPPKIYRCRRCGRIVPEERAKLSIFLCPRCSDALTKPYKEVSVAATSLQWI